MASIRNVITLWLNIFLSASAFPHFNAEIFQADVKKFLHERQTSGDQDGGVPCTAAPPPFDAASQLVSTTGEHAFVAPGPGDARGPCKLCPRLLCLTSCCNEDIVPGLKSC